MSSNILTKYIRSSRGRCFLLLTCLLNLREKFLAPFTFYSGDSFWGALICIREILFLGLASYVRFSIQTSRFWCLSFLPSFLLLHYGVSVF